MSAIPLQAIDWNSIAMVESKGISGSASSRTMELPGLRVRLIEYSNNYLADHWCRKGHLVHCLGGGFTLQLENNTAMEIKKGGSFIVSDDQSSHRLQSNAGGVLLIMDGDFLKPISKFPENLLKPPLQE